MKIAVVGAGSLGLISGAMMTKAGYDCTLVDVNKEQVAALSEKGAKITGKLCDLVPVKASLPGDLTGIFDVIFLQTKQMHMLEALAAVEKNMTDKTVILTLQNGIPEDKVAAKYGKERVIGGTVFHGAKCLEPGVSELTTDVDHMHTYIGELDGSVTPRLKEIETIMSATGGASVTNDILGVKWTKLVMNTIISGVSASLGCTFGAASENADSMRCMAYIANEGAEVMEKKGLIPIDMDGFLPTTANYCFKDKEGYERSERQLKELISYSYDEVASMLQDIWAGRTVCEIDDINGKIVLEGAKFGVQTPFNSKVVEIVKRILKGELKAEFSNIKLFDFPELPL